MYRGIGHEMIAFRLHALLFPPEAATRELPLAACALVRQSR